MYFNGKLEAMLACNIVNLRFDMNSEGSVAIVYVLFDFCNMKKMI